MVLGTPFGHFLDQSYSSPEDLSFGEGGSIIDPGAMGVDPRAGSADGRIPGLPNYDGNGHYRLDATPTPRVDALHIMTLTSPITGQSVTFCTGEALPAWAQPYR